MCVCLLREPGIPPRLPKETGNFRNPPNPFTSDIPLRRSSRADLETIENACLRWSLERKRTEKPSSRRTLSLLFFFFQPTFSSFLSPFLLLQLQTLSISSSSSSSSSSSLFFVTGDSVHRVSFSGCLGKLFHSLNVVTYTTLRSIAAAFLTCRNLK